MKLKWMRWFWMVVALAGLGFGTVISNSRVQAGPAAAIVWPGISLGPVVGGLINPVTIANAGDGSNRLFIVEQRGYIRLVKDNVLQGTPFLDIHTKVSCCGERGFLGLAFPPNYASKGYFYVNYTNTGGDTVVARYSISGNPDLADAGSETILLTIDQPFSNHNGGQLAFGPDGFLYIGMGDGGDGGDPGNRAQTTNVLLGKMLRIHTEGAGCVTRPPHAPKNYCIPGSNPFFSNTSYQPEIWALGVRNPWRFTFDRQTGDLYIADVGQEKQEEVNFQPANSPGGQNYGWRILEGILCFNPSSGCVAPAGYSAPVAWYDHGTNNSNGCSVTGGYVYRGPLFFRMTGIYFYGDLCTGKIYGLKNDGGWQTMLLTDAPFSISTFGEDESGYLYVADYGNGIIYRIQAEIDYSQLPHRTYLPLVRK